MKVLIIFVGFLGVILGAATWAAPVSAESFSSRDYFSEATLPVSTYLRLSSMRCEDCTLIVRDLIEAGAISNNVEAVRSALSGEANYSFRLTLLSGCNHCYRAVHFWEMNMLNRAAGNDEINRWLKSEESKPLVEYFSKI